jgi:hypothetical protein
LRSQSQLCKSNQSRNQLRSQSQLCKCHQL